MSGEEGRLVPPYPRDTCTATDCGNSPLTDEAYLHRDRETGKLVILCGACSLNARLNASLRLPLVAL